MSIFLGALLIFCLRIADVSLGTLRVMNMVRGRRFTAAGLGFIEAGVFILAVAKVFQQLDNPWNMGAYALGFAAGTMLGMTIEGWIASGSILARVICREHPIDLVWNLRDNGFGVTALRGEGKEKEVTILFIVASRRRGKKLIQLVRSIDPKAFITIDPVYQAIGGYLPHVAAPPSVRK